ncbi:hypothetical protein SAMN05216298_3481 [Glycomyces sambucus]|uniref:Uncharacterized protein n=1 Tax=Glycomyces sambucus TaxID=380244 RepID=A0A1G9J7X0_9ACTN|nr:hypothetical protein [Glycomyces sambucus]SDL33630.1 hypothetical protein SAMN05216298_3481 [Glycomyces sambucus]
MSDEIAAWAVTDDPEKLAKLLEAWDTGRLPLEAKARELGLAPDPSRGQRDSIFIYETAAGRRYPMWEPGPDLGDIESDDTGDDSTWEGPDPWAV